MSNQAWVTPKKQQLLQFVAQFSHQNRTSPSYREIQRGLGYKTVATVANHVNQLVASGHLKKQPNKSRSLIVVDQLNLLGQNWLRQQVVELVVAGRCRPADELALKRSLQLLKVNWPL